MAMLENGRTGLSSRVSFWIGSRCCVATIPLDSAASDPAAEDENAASSWAFPRPALTPNNTTRAPNILLFIKDSNALSGPILHNKIVSTPGRHTHSHKVVPAWISAEPGNGRPI